MTPLRRRRCMAIAVLALVALLAAGCGDDEQAAEAVTYGTAGEDITPLPVTLPRKVLGLGVDRENVRKTLRQVEDTYVDALSLYSFRERKLLQATLQVSSFGPAADVTSDSFQRTVVNGLGGQTPREVRVGSDRVWLSTGTNQQVITWFRDDRFFVLSVRQDYPRPRSLLRKLLEVEL